MGCLHLSCSFIYKTGAIGFLYFHLNQCKMYSEMQFSDKRLSIPYLN